jgi:hypothetical protein
MSAHPRLRTRWCLTLILAGLAALGMAIVPGTALAHSGSSPVIGHVYTDANNAGPNTVAVLDRHADGSLTANPGSPFMAGGSGIGHPVEGSPVSSGGVGPNSIAVHGDLVYVSNSGHGGSGNYTGFHLNPRGPPRADRQLDGGDPRRIGTGRRAVQE